MKPILKGKLTKASAALFAIAQLPNLIGDITQTTEVFAQAVAQPVSYLSVVAAVGVVWGGLRAALGYFGR